MESITNIGALMGKEGIIKFEAAEYSQFPLLTVLCIQAKCILTFLVTKMEG